MFGSWVFSPDVGKKVAPPGGLELESWGWDVGFMISGCSNL